MKEVTVATFDELNAFFDAHDRFEGWVYRGQANTAWPLLPRIARSRNAYELRRLLGSVRALGAAITPPHAPLAKLESDLAKTLCDVLVHAENATLRLWRNIALRHVTKPPSNGWQWLALGQHFGLATRLLDWTDNPLAAAFFALRDSGGDVADAAVYALKSASYIDEDDDIDLLDSDSLYRPPPMVDRIILQQALFSVSPPPFDSLNDASDDRLARAIIPVARRELLLRKITSFGVDASTLFPDFGGAAVHVNWHVDNAMSLKRRTPSIDRKIAEYRKEVDDLLAGLGPSLP